MTGYQCCFCGQRIEGGVTALVVLANWNGSETGEAQEGFQQLFCHFECLARKLQKPAVLYRLDHGDE